MVISIVMVIVGVVAMVQLPIAQYPELAPPEILVQATYVGADSQTIEQSVATPIEQQMQGVDNMIYMTSVNDSTGLMRLRVTFDVGTDPNTDQILSQMRYSLAESQLRRCARLRCSDPEVALRPDGGILLYSPNGTYDDTFLSNYAYININDPMSRTCGVGQVQIFGAGQYAMRFWVRPDTLASLGVTISDITDAGKAEHREPRRPDRRRPCPTGQEFTTVRAQGRLSQRSLAISSCAPTRTAHRADADVGSGGAGARNYTQIGRLNGRSAAIIAIYQLPGSNAIDDERAKQLMEDLKKRFPQDLDYMISLDTTLAVTEASGNRQDVLRSAALVIIVVYIFLQGWRATLIPLLAVPVSLVGTFAFSRCWASRSTLYRCLVWCWRSVSWSTMRLSWSKRSSTTSSRECRRGMRSQGHGTGLRPVVAIALILAAVFVPTAFIRASPAGSINSSR